MSALNTILLGMGMLGMRIYASPALEPKPKLKLSPDCPVSDGFRHYMDQWLLEQFGTDTGNIAVQTPYGLAVAPSVMRALKDSV